MNHSTQNDLRLIEAGFPCHQVGAETQRERGASSALPPRYFLHVWWARRPLTQSVRTRRASKRGNQRTRVGRALLAEATCRSRKLVVRKSDIRHRSMSGNSFNLVCKSLSCIPKVISLLKSQPYAGTITTEFAKSHCHFWRNGTSFTDNPLKSLP